MAVQWEDSDAPDTVGSMDVGRDCDRVDRALAALRVHRRLTHSRGTRTVLGWFRVTGLDVDRFGWLP